MGGRIDIVYFDAGTAHRTTAEALAAALGLAGHEVRLHDLEEVFEHWAPLRRTLRGGVAWFNRRLRGESMHGLRVLLPLGCAFHDLAGFPGVERVRRFWRPSPPDVLVSTVPVYNGVLHESLRRERPGAVSVTVPVDFEEPTPGYWFSGAVEQHFLCATSGLVAQARAAGVPGGRVHRISGMIVHPRYYRERGGGALDRSRLGIPEGIPVGIVSFGGQGSRLMTDVAARLEETGEEFGVLFMCGHDARAREALDRLPTRYPKAVLGFTTELDRYLRLADFFIGKAGPVSIHEALVCGTPLVVLESRGMAPLLAANERWVRERGVGVVIRGPAGVAPAVREVLRSDAYRRNARRIGNRAVSEAVELVGGFASRAR